MAFFIGTVFRTLRAMGERVPALLGNRRFVFYIIIRVVFVRGRYERYGL